jgi:hypothetical protein
MADAHRVERARAARGIVREQRTQVVDGRARVPLDADQLRRGARPEERELRVRPADVGAEEHRGSPPWHVLQGRAMLSGFPALRHRNFRLFVVGQGTSLIGFWMQSVAQGWLVYRLQERPLDVGKVAFAGYLPILFLSPVAGVVADRLPRRAMLLVTQTLLMLLAFCLGLLCGGTPVTVPLLIAFAACVGLVSALDVPTRQSFSSRWSGRRTCRTAIAAQLRPSSTGARVRRARDSPGCSSGSWARQRAFS